MQAIRIHTQLDSTTLHLPEVESLLGKRVEIIVREDSRSSFSPGTGEFAAAQSAAEELEDYDFEAVKDLNATDLRESLKHVP